ncbi:MAG TPA: hypothetical protein DEQ87_00035 [Algoriphagus sp.]|mgnify:CR=1 FL=1|jgi:hypothetical protein|uniref:hypothetical protein n=1 Tax=unclassified Algoriphagus TaxID=2641541 RepID=UPI000C5FBA32|nr:MULTISPECIES: hypothetical protein [unclassified Algoriphagus]MAL14846.1 hypothetical protein [Algoriphagus sp.]MAN88483.1 hypothetical protein [Algoriphagus sp.]HAS58238.1 hypothetical protein [Algoriphagus sp.]HAZ24074.1 hypothetical protein [Algoriphagus sp.]HCD86023.1 hypothetical protein [Algoriphagus sp.]|tara:strand:- start:548 stop:769 length:222 start_codon:yes stop_codon:yes gene_type:complete
MITTIINLNGKYDEYQIRAIIPNLLLKNEAQLNNNAVRTRNDFEIIDIKINRIAEEEFQIEVLWNLKQKKRNK